MHDSEKGRTPDDVPGQLAPLLARPEVPRSLEIRVASSLETASLLRHGRSQHAWRLPLVAAIAAGVLCFLAGQWTESRRRSDDDPTLRPAVSSTSLRFVLLLYGPSEKRSTAGDVEEHRQWARHLAAEGHSVSGEKLAPEEPSLRRDSAPTSSTNAGETLQGFFVISARSDAEAMAIARSAPHVRHGGRIVVRRIEPT